MQTAVLPSDAVRRLVSARQWAGALLLTYGATLNSRTSTDQCDVVVYKDVVRLSGGCMGGACVEQKNPFCGDDNRVYKSQASPDSVLGHMSAIQTTPL